MKNLKFQRYWILLSNKKIPVLSSLIAREKRPKEGEWVEVSITPCCQRIVSYEGVNVPEIEVKCGEAVVATQDSDSITNLVTEFNNSFSQTVGTLELKDGVLLFTPLIPCNRISITVREFVEGPE